MKSSALKILKTLCEHGFTALFVGGCVRDMLMGKEPGDYDIATDASPEQVMQIFKRTIPVGVQFGIVIVLMKGGKFEVAQFRNTTDPINYLREDALHRDFTINGMFYDPDKEQVFDYVGGQRDIERRLIRGIENPYDRFIEDRLRMIRAIRFAVTCDYQIEADTLAAIRGLASQISSVSIERIRDELLKILMSPHPDQGLRLLDETGLLLHILPEVAAMKGVAQPEQFHPEGDVFTHTLLMLQYLAHSSFRGDRKQISPEFAMGVLLHDVGKPQTFTETDRIRFHNHDQVGAEIAENLCIRFKFSAKAIEKITTLVKEHGKFVDVEQMKKSTLKRFLRQEHIADLLELHRLDRLSSRRDLGHYQFCLAKLEEFRNEKETIRPSQLISGKDLIQLGIVPGPVFKQLLEYIEDAQLEGTVSTKQEALELVQEIQDTLGFSANPLFTQKS
ncbi:poly(A) polymerase [Candidatus Vecturithrix granuli]|uniref:Poly(A) polymerase n=1 Tax=Vecturithrix granuli TaxID=1499967 RepID=A0A081C7G3_VECG1|nr:poly(A) polymerase [Candidatus Vecturithrix granuli]